MLFNVYCTRENSRLGLIQIEAETPAAAVAEARRRGWQVQDIEYAEHPIQAADAARSPASRVTGCFAIGGMVIFFLTCVGVLVPSSPSPSSPPLHRISAPAPTESIRVPAHREPFQRCAEPIGWRIAYIDPRFNISPDDVVRAVERGIDVWESEWQGGPLFVYDASGGMPIKLEYDPARNQALRQKVEYEQRLEDYNQEVEQFNARAAQYDRDVAAWNRTGGRGSEAQHRRLQEEKRLLDARSARLRQDEVELDGLRPRMMIMGMQLADYAEQSKIDHTSRIVEITHREITVHAFEDADHLSFILAHELGHALLGPREHLTAPEALMHATPMRPLDGRLRLSEADRRALRDACGGAVRDPSIEPRMQR